MGITVKKAVLVFFLLILGFYLAGILMMNVRMQLVLKPILIPALIVYYLSATRHSTSPLQKWILAALLFSWVGDVLLMFQDYDGIFFLLGLSAFLIAHIFYILFFHRIRTDHRINGKLLLLLAVALYYFALMAWLSPHLGEMKLPVWVYGFFISLMLLLALHTGGAASVRGGKMMLAGAVLFVVSDSLLAINKFHGAFPYAHFLVIITYGFAQLLLVTGAANYSQQPNTR